MNTWIRKTRKRVICKYCEKFIETGEYQVVCQYFMKLKSGKTWKKIMHFHATNPSCWVDRAITVLETKPFTETRGRKPDALSDVVKTARQKILRRRASVMQRISNEMEGQVRPCKLTHMTELLEKLAVEIKPLGGIPKTWL